MESRFAADLNIDTPPLFMSSDLNQVGGRARAVQRKALAIDLCVMTRRLLPDASSISALQGLSRDFKLV